MPKGLRQIPPFEKRLHQIPYPRIKNADGSYSTHRMSDAEVDGRYIAYPTIQQMDDGRLAELVQQEALRRALKRKNYREFPTAEEASAYARGGYKQGTNIEEGFRRR